MEIGNDHGGVDRAAVHSQVAQWLGCRGWPQGAAGLLWIAVAAHAQFGSQAVDIASAARGVTVTATATGTVSSVEVLTMGAAGMDFAQGAGASTCGTATFNAQGQTCTEYVAFTPSAPGVRMGAVELEDAAGRVLGVTYLGGVGTGSLGVLVPGNELTVAGNGTYLGSVGDGNAATSAELYLPAGVAVDGAGNLYIADSAHNRIRMVCAGKASATIKGTACSAAGVIATIAGNGAPQDSGDQGPASAATMNNPTGVAVDGAGNLYVADTGNNAIRMIASASGEISTVVGGSSGGYSGDGGLATAAQLRLPQGATLDAGGNLYIADTGNHRIRMVSSSTRTISTVAGNGFTNMNGDGGYSGDGGLATGAELNYPHAVAFDAAGNMYIPDMGNNRVREVAAVGGAITATSTITTLAGTGIQAYSGDGGPASQAGLWGPSGVVVDAAGNVLIADTQNNAIRKVKAASLGISTAIGAGVGNLYQGGMVNAATFYGPTGLVLDGKGNLFVADTLNMLVREVEGNVAALGFAMPVRQFDKSAAMSQTIENDGNAALDITVMSPGANAALDAATTTCTIGNPPLGVAGDCAAGAVFSPMVAGNPVAGIINVGNAGDTVNSPLAIEMVGDATAVNSTTTTVASSLNPSGFGQGVTLTATVTTGASAGNLTGTVTFLDGSTALASGVALGAPATTATAVSPTFVLAVGKHPITASYSGDPGHTSSSSTDPNGVGQARPPLMQDVLEGTSTSLASSANPTLPGQSVTLTATTSALGGGGVTPDGSITFIDGATILTNAALNGNATAAYTTKLSGGAHPITATYGGDAAKDIQGSTSQVLDQTVQTATTIALISSGNPSTYLSPVTFTATITASGNTAASGTVNFLDGSVTIGTGALAGSPAAARFTTSALTVGAHTMTASYGGDTANEGSSSSPISQTVSPIATTTQLTTSKTTGASPQAVLVATVVAASGPAPAGTVTFTSGGTALGTATLDAGGMASFTPTLPNGNYSVVAVYGGDTIDSPSTSQAVEIAGTAGSFSVSLEPTITLKTTQNATVTVTLTSSAGFADSIGLGCGSLPAGITCHFSPLSVTLAASGTASDQLTIDTNDPLSGGPSAMNRQSLGRGRSLAGALVSFSLLFGGILWRFRRGHAGVWNVLLAMLLSAATLLMAGCSGMSMGSATPGTYVIQVTATGTTTNMVHFQNVTLIITN